MPISTFPRHDYYEDEYLLKHAGLRDTHSEGKVISVLQFGNEHTPKRKERRSLMQEEVAWMETPYNKHTVNLAFWRFWSFGPIWNTQLGLFSVAGAPKNRARKGSPVIRPQLWTRTGTHLMMCLTGTAVGQ
jgi:hypothetical protein